MEEIWRDIRGYEGLYQISNLKRVKSIKTRRILKPIQHSKERYQVGLYKNGKCKKFYIDTLVEQEFCSKNKRSWYSNKKYFCVICHKVLKKEMPIRLVKQEYGAGTYKQYYSIDHYDICINCYKEFDNWILKHKKE